MERFDLGNIFQGISTLLQADSAIMYARIGLILLGILLVYLGRRGVLEPLVMIPMGLGMAAVNAGVLIFPGGMHGNLFLDPMVTETDQLMNILQIDFLQPIYTFTFSNGLIACLIFMGIGTMLDINFRAGEALAEHVPRAVRRAGHVRRAADRLFDGVESQRQRLDRDGRRGRRADGAFHLAQPLEGDLRADHRRRLSLSRA